MPQDRGLGSVKNNAGACEQLPSILAMNLALPHQTHAPKGSSDFNHSAAIGSAMNIAYALTRSSDRSTLPISWP